VRCLIERTSEMRVVDAAQHNIIAAAESRVRAIQIRVVCSRGFVELLGGPVRCWSAKASIKTSWRSPSADHEVRSPGGAPLSALWRQIRSIVADAR